MDNSQKIILHLCAEEGSDSKPYADAGYDVRIINKEIGVENYTPPPGVYGIIANPPCTMFSIARTKAKTPRDLREGMRLVKECLRIIWECQYRAYTTKSYLKFWAIENPATGMLKTFLGNPAFKYCQSEYGANFTKRTALWGYFNLPVRPILFAQLPGGYSLGGDWKCGKHLAFSGDNDGGGMKSACPINFARAFFEANQ